MTETRLSIQAHPCTVQLTVIGGLEGLTPTSINLQSSDGAWMMKVPSGAFTGIPVNPGEQLVASLTLFRCAVEPVPEKLTDLSTPGLIIPKAN